jgi:hypothetical protein
MSQQREFWPQNQPAPRHPPVWERLEENQRALVRVRLAQLIQKAIQSRPPRPFPENPHDA